jgi:exosortase/archaeosortase family protein
MIKLTTRYILAILIGIFYSIYYTIFKPITLWISFSLIKFLDSSAILINNQIYTTSHILTFIDACVAATAYLLLTILILITRGISWKRRLYMFIFGSILILAFNLVRIEILFYFLLNFKYNIFENLHMIIWKFLSTIYVFFVWIYLTKYFRVRQIPIYSDYKYLIKRIKGD